MNRRIGIWIIVALLVGYPAAAGLIGLSVEHQWEQREQQILAKYPYITVVKRNYHRGVFSSTEEVTYGLRSPLLKSLSAIPGGAAQSVASLQLTVRNTIHHGPLPQLHTFAPAIVDTEWVLPPQLSQQLAAVFGDKTHLTLQTRMKWFGGSTTVLQSPAFQQQLSGDITLASRGFDGRLDLGGDIRAMSVRLTSPGFDLKSAKNNLGFQDFNLNMDVQPAFDDLSVGSVNMTLGRLDVEQTAKGVKASVRNLSLDSKSSVNGEYMDMDVKFGVDALETAQFSATRLGYGFRLDHVHGPSLAALTKAMQTAQAASGTAALSSETMRTAFKTDGVEILLRNPVLEIPRIGFVMPEGELLISIKAAIPGLTRAELDGPSNAVTAALVKHLQASADVRIDTALLDKLLDSSGKGDALTPKLQALQGQGYIKLDGKALTTHLRYQDGQLRINDLAFPPRPPAQ